MINENTIKIFKNKYKFNYAILRYFNVVGSDLHLRTGDVIAGSLFVNLCNTIKKNGVFSIFGNDYSKKDGTCVRDYIDINDLSELHLEAHEYIKRKKQSILFNCGYNKPVKVLDIINKFNSTLNIKIKTKFRKRRIGDAEKIYASTKLQKKILKKWKPRFQLSDSVRNSFAWSKKINL